MTKSTHDEVELDLVIAEIDEPADGVRSLVLRDPAGDPLPAWRPGAHIDIDLDDGLTRQYSLCGDPADTDSWRIAVLREVEGRGGSQYVHDKLGVGDRVHARGPRNHFPLEASPRYVFVAGGIGITPLLPMIAAADSAGADWVLHYGGRTRASISFAAELTEQYGDKVVVHPQDEQGLLDLDALIGTPQAHTLVYCCGPEPLLQAVEVRCATWPAGALHLERFSPKEQAPPTGAESFEVELADSGMTVTVPGDKSILAAVEEAGINVLSSCQEGTCGTCETGVLEGEVDHRDSLLTDAEQEANDVMFICVSRARCPKLLLEL